MNADIKVGEETLGIQWEYVREFRDREKTSPIELYNPCILGRTIGEDNFSTAANASRLRCPTLHIRLLCN